MVLKLFCFHAQALFHGMQLHTAYFSHAIFGVKNLSPKPTYLESLEDRVKSQLKLQFLIQNQGIPGKK
jgi:hypothetical protein